MPKSKTNRVIRSFSLPADMNAQMEALVNDQEKRFSAIIRGALLHTWSDYFANHLGAQRYAELIQEYHDTQKEGEA